MAQKNYLVTYTVPYLDGEGDTCYDDGRVLVVRSSSVERVLERLHPLLPYMDRHVVAAMQQEGRGERGVPLTYFGITVTELKAVSGFVRLPVEKLRNLFR